MMPEIVFLIPILAIVGWVLTEVSSNFFDYLKESREAAAGGASLTTSELEALIASAVEEANQELNARVEKLEAQLKATRGRPLLEEPPASERAPLDGAVTTSRQQVQ